MRAWLFPGSGTEWWQNILLLFYYYNQTPKIIIICEKLSKWESNFSLIFLNRSWGKFFNNLNTMYKWNNFSFLYYAFVFNILIFFGVLIESHLKIKYDKWTRVPRLRTRSDQRRRIFELCTSEYLRHRKCSWSQNNKN